VIPSRRLACAARDQGIPTYEFATREWELQSVASPPRTAPAVVQEVAEPAGVEVSEVQDVSGDDS
jgi:hypothetical protein